MKNCALILVVCLGLITAGCGVGTQSQAQAPTQQQSAGSQTASCTLALAYDCPDPVVGQSYVCTPTVSEVAAYPCTPPSSSARSSVQAMVRPERGAIPISK